MIAMRIRELLRSQKVVDKETGKLRNVRYSDIVILTRSVKGFADVFTEVLNREGIPAYAGTSEGYFQTQEVGVLLDYLRVLDNRRQDIPLAAVPTVDALAYNLYGCEQLICPIMDARRGQVYTGIYTFVNGEMQVIQEQCAISVEELAGRLKEECEKYGKKVVLLGDGVPVYREKVQEILQEQCEFAPASCNRQRAACVAVLGQSLAAAGKTVSSDDFAPEYLRMSQAERERMEADEAHRELMKAGITK